MKPFFTIFLFLYLSSGIFYAQSTASRNVSTFKIEAPQLHTQKKIWVYLPEDYSANLENYPVIYMHDAQNLFDKETSYVGEWRIDEALDSLKSPKSIIIGIEHGNDKRIDELTPFPNEKYGGGNGDAYLSFIKFTLKPFIDATYRTLPGKEHTGIFGSSLGGLISFYAALKYPETFSMIGVYSPSFWFSEKIYDFAENAPLQPGMKFYFLAGTNEGENVIPNIEKMVSLLEEKGLKKENYKTKFIDGGEHNEKLWSDAFPTTYTWLLANKK